MATDATFEKEVLTQKGPVLVDFGATWCGPCKALKPIIETVARETSGTVRVVYVDMDEAPETVRKFSIKGAPTLMVFQDGEKRAVHTGLVPKEKILALIARAAHA